MRKFLLIFLFFVYSCGYQPLYTNKNFNKLTFKEIVIQGDKDINRGIVSSTFIKQDLKNFYMKK